MSDDCVACLARAAGELLSPHRVGRIALLGDDQAELQEDVHLLVESAPTTPPDLSWRLAAHAARSGPPVRLPCRARLR